MKHPFFTFFTTCLVFVALSATMTMADLTDGLVGYLADPEAYRAREYATVTVPKILDLPPFTPNAAREFTAAVGRLLNTA